MPKPVFCMLPLLPAATFENVERWLKELRDHADANIVRTAAELKLLQPH